MQIKIIGGRLSSTLRPHGADTTINSADFDGVNLIAIQALEKRTASYKNEMEGLKKENAELKNMFLTLQKEVAALKENNK